MKKIIFRINQKSERQTNKTNRGEKENPEM